MSGKIFLSIECDGFGSNVEVRNASTGEVLAGVEHIDFRVGKTGLTEVTLRLMGVALNVKNQPATVLYEAF